MDKSLTQVVIHVMAGNVPTIDEDWSSDLKDLLRKCWLRDPKQRPDMRTVMSDLREILREDDELPKFRMDSSKLNQNEYLDLLNQQHVDHYNQVQRQYQFCY